MKGVKLVNLQVMLEAGASELSSGKLVHCHAFNFSRAMSALVILNSKQDAGVSFLDIRAPDDRLPLDLTDDEIAYVFDSLLACEATWHNGRPLWKTLYTCTYLNLKTVKKLESCSPVMIAYFDAVHCFVDTIRYIVSTAGVYGDEELILPTVDRDVGISAYDLECQQDITTERLKDAEMLVMKKLPRTSILLSRVRFRINLHIALNRLCKAATFEDLHAARQNLDVAMANLTIIQNTTPAVPVKTNADCGPDDGELDWDPNGLGFNGQTSLMKLGAHPPTEVKLLSRKAAFNHYSKLVADLKRVCVILGSHLRIGAAHDFFFSLLSMQSADPGIIPRSVVALFLFTGRDVSSPGHLFRDEFSSLLPSTLSSTYAVQKTVDVASYKHTTAAERENEEQRSGSIPNGIKISGQAIKVPERGQIAGCFHNLDCFSSNRSVELLARAYLFNRSRLRQKLRRLSSIWAAFCRETTCLNHTHRRLDSWDSSMSAHLFSPKSQGRAFCWWTKFMLLRLQISHVLLGIDLHLYVPHELHMVYWCIGKMLNILTDLVEVSGAVLNIDYVGESGVCGRNMVELYICEVHKKICKGLVLMLVALEKIGYLRKPVPSTFTDSEQSFWQRFSTLSYQDMMLLRWSDYDDHVAVCTNMPTVYILSAAASCFVQAKRQARDVLNVQPSVLSTEQVEDMIAVELVAKANAAAMRLLRSPTNSAKLVHNHHKHFVTLVL